MKWLKDALVSGLQAFLAWVAGWFAGKNHEQNKALSAELEERREDAQSWADAPRTDGDFDRRVLDLAEERRKRDSKLRR